jgi:predicted phage-related endonuclease
MIILNLKQGTPEWHAARATHDCASEAAAALGLAKNCTRSELMKIKHTGITPDVSGWTQKFLFDKGHEAEALARPIVANILGEALLPVTGESDDGKMLASLDGFTRFGDTVWENKMMNPELRDYIVANNDLPDTHWPQCEQQILVTGADRVYFTVSDGTEEGTTGIFYESNPERRQLLIAGWTQFNEDLKNYELPEVKPAAVAEVIEDLPALTVQLVGQVTASNLANFQTVVLARIQAINTNLFTDNDFATADKMVKFLDDGEKRLDLVKSQALSQTASIDELFRTIDGLKAEMKSKRLTLDKLVKAEKENRKAEIVREAADAIAGHIIAIHRRIGVAPTVQVNFGEAIKGLKSLDSMRDKVSVALANAKIEANAIADRIESNIKSLEEDGQNWRFLFPDMTAVCTKAADDFAALLAARKASHQQAEAARIEKIRAEEQAKAEAAAAAKVAEQARIAKEAADAQTAAEQAERNRVAEEEIRRIDAERKAADEEPVLQDVNAAFDREFAATPSIVFSEKVIADANARQFVDSIPAGTDTGATLKLGDICGRLGFTVNADFLASLGINPVSTEKNAKLYAEAKFPTICRLISEHVMALAFKKAA